MITVITASAAVLAFAIAIVPIVLAMRLNAKESVRNGVVADRLARTDRDEWSNEEQRSSVLTR